MSQGQGQTEIPISEATAFPNGDNSGTVTLVAGTATVSFPRLTANSRIFLTLKTANTTTLTTAYTAPASGRDPIIAGVGTGTFVVRANVAAGTINVADISTLDWFVIP